MSSAVSPSSPSSSSQPLRHHYLKLHHSPLSSKLNLHLNSKLPFSSYHSSTHVFLEGSIASPMILEIGAVRSTPIFFSSNNDVEDEEEDRSLDLLVRFIENVFKKVSKRARKAVRSVLPPSISTKLVICTLGSAVFVSILLIRVIWSAVAYLQESRSFNANVLDDDHRVWSGSQPAT